MIQRLFAGGLFAGLSAGALAALLQLVFVVPLIHQGELYETGVLTHFAAPAAEDGGHDHAPGEETAPHDHPDPDTARISSEDEVAAEIAAIPFDARRTAATFGMFLVTYTGFALLLTAGFALAARAGHSITARTGAVWGLCGFLAVQLAPAFGLPPELPGGLSAPLEQRQLWWAGCVAATTAGIALLAFGRGLTALALGALVIALPHVIGAPEVMFSGLAPPELTAHFAGRVFGAGAVAWVLLGAVAGAFWARDS